MELSELYRSYQLQQADQLANAEVGLWTTGESTKGQFAGLFSEDPELAATVQNILDNGEQNLGFAVSFEFQNGAITDSNAEEAAKEKMKAIQATVMGLVDEYNKNLSDNNAGLSPDELNKMRIESVKIRADASGGYELIDAENMDQSKVDAIMRIVARAGIIRGRRPT